MCEGKLQGSNVLTMGRKQTGTAAQKRRQKTSARQRRQLPRAKKLLVRPRRCFDYKRSMYTKARETDLT
jgi:hypothetical protein